VLFYDVIKHCTVPQSGNLFAVMPITFPCLKYLGALTNKWQICNSMWPTYCLLHITQVPSVTSKLVNFRFWFSGKLSFFLRILKQLKLWICCVFHGNHEVHIVCKPLTKHRFVFFLSIVKQDSCGWF